MRVLYERTTEEVPEGFILAEIEKDIIDNFKPHYNLFSVSQIAERTNQPRGRVQRRIRKLVKLGLVKRRNRIYSQVVKE